MKYAKWLILSHALCLILGGVILWFAIARPRIASDAERAAERQRKYDALVAELESGKTYITELERSLDDQIEERGRLFESIKRINTIKTRLEQDNHRLGESVKRLEQLIGDDEEATRRSKELLGQIERLNNDNLVIVSRVQDGSRRSD